MTTQSYEGRLPLTPENEADFLVRYGQSMITLTLGEQEVAFSVTDFLSAEAACPAPAERRDVPDARIRHIAKLLGAAKLDPEDHWLLPPTPVVG